MTRVSVRATRGFINKEKNGLILREEEMQQLAKCGLILPILLTITHS